MPILRTYGSSITLLILFVSLAPQDLERKAHGSSLVKISQLQQVEFPATGKSWIIPSTLMKDSDHGHQWLQIQAANYALCNLLSSTKVDRLPTLKGSKGLVALLQMRSLQMNSSSMATSSEQLFETEASPKRKPKRKHATETECLHLDLGDSDTLLIKSARKANEDLHRAFTVQNVSIFFHYMYEMGAQSSTIERRTYQSTGKYAKSGKIYSVPAAPLLKKWHSSSNCSLLGFHATYMEVNIFRLQLWSFTWLRPNQARRLHDM